MTRKNDCKMESNDTGTTEADDAAAARNLDNAVEDDVAAEEEVTGAPTVLVALNNVGLLAVDDNNGTCS